MPNTKKQSIFSKLKEKLSTSSINSKKEQKPNTITDIKKQPTHSNFKEKLDKGSTTFSYKQVTQDQISKFLDDIIYKKIFTSDNIADNTLLNEYFSGASRDIINFVKSVNQKTNDLYSVISMSGDVNTLKRLIKKFISVDFKNYLVQESKNYSFKKLIKKYSQTLQNKVTSGIFRPLLLIQVTQDNINDFFSRLIYANFCYCSKTVNELQKECFSKVTIECVKKEIEGFVRDMDKKTKELSMSAIDMSGSINVWRNLVFRCITVDFTKYLDEESQNYGFGEFIKEYSSNLKKRTLASIKDNLKPPPLEFQNKLEKIQNECEKMAQIATSEMLAHWRYYCDTEKISKENSKSHKKNTKNLNKAIANAEDVLNKCHNADLIWPDSPIIVRLKKALNQVENYLRKNKNQLITNSKSGNLKNNYNVDTKINTISEKIIH